MGNWGGGGCKEGEKYFFSYKRQLVTLVLYLLKCDGKCKTKKKKNMLRKVRVKNKNLSINILQTVKNR